jgi:hypothetical protein
MLTKFQFRSRFTPEEKVAIEIASLDVPTAPMEQRIMAASLRTAMTDLHVSGEVDVTLAATIQGVQMLEQFGLIGPGRANQILAPVAGDSDASFEQIILEPDHLAYDEKHAVAVGGAFGPYDLVEVYRVTDPQKRAIGSFTAKYIITGQPE